MKAAGEHSPAVWRRAVVIILVAVAVGAGAWLVHQQGKAISSDDATLDAEVVHIASTVGGRISRISVKENSSVRAGEELFQIDPEPLQLAVNQAEADLALARATLATPNHLAPASRSPIKAAIASGPS